MRGLLRLKLKIGTLLLPKAKLLAESSTDGTLSASRRGITRRYGKGHRFQAGVQPTTLHQTEHEDS